MRKARHDPRCRCTSRRQPCDRFASPQRQRARQRGDKAAHRRDRRGARVRPEPLCPPAQPGQDADDHRAGLIPHPPPGRRTTSRYRCCARGQRVRPADLQRRDRREAQPVLPDAPASPADGRPARRLAAAARGRGAPARARGRSDRLHRRPRNQRRAQSRARGRRGGRPAGDRSTCSSSDIGASGSSATSSTTPSGSPRAAIGSAATSGRWPRLGWARRRRRRPRSPRSIRGTRSRGAGCWRGPTARPRSSPPATRRHSASWRPRRTSVSTSRTTCR